MKNKESKLKKAERYGVSLRRERILKAAKEVFAEKGFKETTVDEIGSLANVGKGTIYRLVGEKKKLFHAVLHQAGDLLVEEISKGINKKIEPVEKLRNVVEVMSAWYEKNMDLGKVLFSALHNDFTKKSVEGKSRHHILTLVENIFKEGVKKKVFSKDIDTAIATEVIFHLFTPFFYEEIKKKYKYNSKQIAEYMFDMFFKGFRG